MKNKRKINDLIIIVLLLAISVSTYFVLNNEKQDVGDYVYIELNNEKFGVYDLNTNKVITIKSGNVENIVVIENATVHMEYSNCSNQICVFHKRISKDNEQIICLPNKVLIGIKSTNENDIDAISE